MASLAQVHPDWDRYVLLADKNGGDFDPNVEPFVTIEIEHLDIQSKYQLIFQYTVLEMSTAAKPWLLSRLFSDRYDRVVYFDPDILVYTPLAEVEKAWSLGALAVLTPHLTGRLLDDKYPGERDILLSGTYNLGFIALARHRALEPFLAYWREKSLASFAVDIKAGLFTDQKWIDPVPGMFPDVHIVRHEGYNVAYWNLPHRSVTRHLDHFEVNGQPLVFFHFSGLNPQQPESLSKHQNRLMLDDIGDGADVVRQYCDLVREAGHDACRGWPYAFDLFDDGTFVLPEMRLWYRTQEDLRASAGPNPFQSGALDFNHVVVAATGDEPPITRLMEAVYAARPDLHGVFLDIRGRDRVAYGRWFVTHGARQHAIPERYLEPVRAALDGSSGTRSDAVAGRATRLARKLDPRPWLRREMDRIISRARSGGSSDATRAPRRAFVPDTSGFWPQSDEDRRDGMTWMGRSATVRLGARDRLEDVVTIEGHHSPALHIQAGNSDAIRITASLNGVWIGDERITTGGQFVVSFRLPPALPHERGDAVLGINCDTTFVPASFGLGSDIRIMSVRVKEVRVGNRVILDFARHPGAHQPASESEVRAFNIIGYASAPSGVGQSARLCAGAARAAGLRASLIDCGEVVDHGMPADDVARLCPINVLHANADQVPALAGFLGPTLLRDRYNVGVWHWELGEFPDRWLESFGPLDEVWAPSRFIQEAVAAKSPIPVVHMPHGVEVPRVAPASRRDFDLPDDRCLFLLMYDMRSFQARKNPEAAIESFARAFPDGRGAALVIKIVNGAASPPDLVRLKERCHATPGVILIDEAFSSKRVHQLQSVCDGYVSLHRSEGFGFNLAESMLLGKPVVATGWSGNMDFMDAETACLVKYALAPIESDVGPYWAGQIWAEPDVEHAAWHLKRLAANESLRQDIGRTAAAHLSTHFSPRAAGQRMRDRLRIIGRMCPPTLFTGREAD